MFHPPRCEIFPVKQYPPTLVIPSAARNLLHPQGKPKRQILRGVYPEPFRFAQGRSQAEGERAQDDSGEPEHDGLPPLLGIPDVKAYRRVLDEN